MNCPHLYHNITFLSQAVMVKALNLSYLKNRQGYTVKTCLKILKRTKIASLLQKAKTSLLGNYQVTSEVSLDCFLLRIV